MKPAPATIEMFGRIATGKTQADALAAWFAAANADLNRKASQ